MYEGLATKLKNFLIKWETEEKNSGDEILDENSLNLERKTRKENLELSTLLSVI